VNPRTWKVGDLAKQTKLSVRTLHYYEEIGLLRPSVRTESGHRLYTETDIARLQRILMLRQLGFSLEDIQLCLDRPEYEMAPLIDLHVARIEQEMALQQSILQKLVALRRHLQDEDSIPVTQFLKTMEAITMLEKHLTPEQLQAVRAHHQQDRESGGAISQAWRDLFAGIQSHIDAGDDPAIAPVQALAEKWRALVATSTKGDAAFARSVKTLYDESPQARERVGMSTAVWEYAKSALAVSPGENGW
jgi:DNA-binding transcriptional MerR regulator